MILIVIWKKGTCLKNTVKAVVQQLVFVQHYNKPGQCLFLFCYFFLLRNGVFGVYIFYALVFFFKVFRYQVPVMRRSSWRHWSTVIACCSSRITVVPKTSSRFKSVLKEMVQNLNQISSKLINLFFVSLFVKEILASIQQ